MEKSVEVEKKQVVEYDDLLPSDDIEDPVSFNAIQRALDNPRINNIALTGNYGSGKSSILKTYIKNHPERKYIEISLASFNGEMGPDSSEIEEQEIPRQQDIFTEHGTKPEGSEEKTVSKSSMQDIETSILQQIVYKKSEADLPNSRLSRIKNTTPEQLKSNVLAVLSFLFALLGIFCADKILGYFLPYYTIQNHSYMILTYFVKYVSVIFFIRPLQKITYYVCEKYHGIDIRKISVKAAEIELKSSFHDSVLNRRIDEILYFFERTDYDVVIFEDLDRFNNPEIFTHLRELNLLLNGYEKIKTEKRSHICFIYALRDELFTNTDRVKFFDFILPVIPVINSSNAPEILIQKRRAFPDRFKDINEDFLTDVGLFINDMRLLKNIINEYFIYEQKINNGDHTKLFAIVLFKNIYPKEFSSLQNGEGLIVNIFNEKKNIVDKINEANKTELKIKEKDLEKISSEILSNIKDLRLLYLTQFFRDINRNINMQQLSTFITDTAFNNIEYTHKISYLYIHNYYGNFQSAETEESFDFEKIQNELGHQYSYQQRVKNFEQNKTIAANKLQSEIRTLKSDIQTIEMLSLQQLFKRYNETVMDTLHAKKVPENDLLIYLLSNGYIDENYHECISYFYPGSLTEKDRQYVISVRINKSKGYDYVLGNIDNVIKNIRSEEWLTNFAVLNNSLLSHLLSHQQKYQQQVRLFLQLMGLENGLGFFVQYLNKPLMNFIDLSFMYCPGLWGRYSVIGVDSSDLEDKALLFIASIPLEHITNISDGTLFVAFVNSSENIFRTIADYDKTADIFQKLVKLNVKFESLSFDLTNNVMADIIENDLYSITFDTIQRICFYLTKEPTNKKYTDCYTIITESENQKLISYIEKNITDFVQKVLLPENAEAAESEHAIVSLLENENITDDDKKKILDKNKTVISDINLIKDKDLWPVVVKNKTVKPVWDNVIFIFTQYGQKLQQDFLDYLNDITVVTELVRNDISDDEEKKNILKSLFELLYKDNEFTLESLKTIDKKSKWRFKQYDYTRFKKERIDFLIKTNSIAFTNNEYINLKKIDNEYGYLFFVHYIDEYLDNEDKNDVEPDRLDIEKIIKDKTIVLDKRIALFKKEKDKLLSESDTVSLDIIEFMQENKLVTDVSNGNFDSIMQCVEIPSDKKIKLLLDYSPCISDNSNYLEYLGKLNRAFLNIDDKRFVMVDDLPIFLKLFDDLKKRQIASTFKSADKNKMKINLCTKRKSHE
ncbi:MAG: hypothetical protein WCR31_10005 [Treponema sp.]